MMQISRHWRLNAQRYRLEGVRYQSGSVSLQQRPASMLDEQTQEQDYELSKQTETHMELQKVAS